MSKFELIKDIDLGDEVFEKMLRDSHAACGRVHSSRKEAPGCLAIIFGGTEATRWQTDPPAAYDETDRRMYEGMIRRIRANPHCDDDEHRRWYHYITDKQKEAKRLQSDSRVVGFANLWDQITAYNRDAQALNALMILVQHSSTRMRQVQAHSDELHERRQRLQMLIESARYLSALEKLGMYRGPVAVTPQHLLARYLPDDHELRGHLSVAREPLYATNEATKD